MVVIVVGTVVVLGAPLVLDVDFTIKASAIFAFAIIGLSLVVLTGWAGQISLGQMAIVGIGAAASATCTSRWHVDLTLALLIGGLTGGLVAFAVGLPALRLRGLYLAVTTFAFGLATEQWLLSDRFFGGSQRRELRAAAAVRPDLTDTPIPTMYSRSSWCHVPGIAELALADQRRVIIAVRENERAAQSYSIPVVRAKLTAFVISGVLAGIGGALFTHLTQSFSVASYSTGESFSVFTSAVIGGLGSLGGAVLGAVYLRGIRWFITSQEWQLLSTGGGVLLVLLIPAGGRVDAIASVRPPADPTFRPIAAEVPEPQAPPLRCPRSRRCDAHSVTATAIRERGFARSDGSRHSLWVVLSVQHGGWSIAPRSASTLPNICARVRPRHKVLGLLALVSVAASCAVPIAQYADRSRVPLAVLAIVWAMFGGLTDLATGGSYDHRPQRQRVGEAVMTPPTTRCRPTTTRSTPQRGFAPSTARRSRLVHRSARPGCWLPFGWRAVPVFVIPPWSFAVIALSMNRSRPMGTSATGQRRCDAQKIGAVAPRVGERCRRSKASSGSGGACRSWPLRSSDSSRWRHCCTSRSSASTSAPAASLRRSPSRSHWSVWCWDRGS
jgi:ABC-type branched-subunit amino acid transport system permease subunit